MNTETQSEVNDRFEATIPADLRDAFKHLTYAEMAEEPACAEWADELRQFEQDWWNASDAA